MSKTDYLGLNIHSENDNMGNFLGWRKEISGTDENSNMMILNAWAKIIKNEIDSKLPNTTVIPAAQVNSDWNATSGVAQILNKPNFVTPSEFNIHVSGEISEPEGRHGIRKYNDKLQWFNDEIWEDISVNGAVSALGTCVTTAAIATKVVTSASDFELNSGARISVVFTYANTAASPMMNINDTGAIPIYNARTNTYPLAGALGAGTHDFIYNGMQWVLLNPLTIGHYINGVFFDSSGNITNYGTSPTTYSTASKVATCASTFSLISGARVSIKFTYGNAINNVTLNVNSTGAYAIAIDGLANSYLNFASWAPGSIVDFVFDGTYWQAINISSDIYYCCGTGDSTMLATIINNFYNSGTTLAKKITIRGTMGIAFTNTYYAMKIEAVNTRGAVCTLDFSDCHIPIITTATRDFLYATSNTIILEIYGLSVSTTRYGVNLGSTKSCTFYGGSIKSTGAGSAAAVYLNNGYTSVFNNCIISGAYYGVELQSGGLNIFNSCKIDGGNTGVYYAGATSVFNGGNISSGSGIGLWLIANATGGITAFGVRINGATWGIYAENVFPSTVVNLMACRIAGVSMPDIHQSSSASTMRWNIQSCSFSKSSFRVNDTVVDASTPTISNRSLYFPAYSNLFDMYLYN